MNTKIIKFDINKNLYNTLIAKQGDTKSRFLLFNLLDGSIPFSLENRSVRVYAVKPDRTEVFNDLIITDAAKGYCILELTTQMLAVAGTVKLELMVIEEDKKLTSSIFYMDVKESINSEKAVVSTNEFGALLTALSSLNEYDNYKREIAAARDGEANLLTKVKKIDEQLDNITQENNIEILKNRKYKIGERVYSNLYGGSTWIVKSSEDVKIQHLNIVFDDELHLMVNLNGGGTAILECQINSINGYLREKNQKKYRDLFAKLKRRQPVKIACQGNSVTFGQYTGQSGAIPTNGTETGYGDGSTHQHDQIPIPYPSVLQNTLREIFGDNITVLNKGYSGDRVSNGYNRHRLYSNQDCTIFEYGINDNAYCTSNGANPNEILNPNNNWSLENFINCYRKLVAREILRGSNVILFQPHMFNGMVGYDGTTYSSSKIMTIYNNGIKSLGEELGVLVVDMNEFLHSYNLTTVTFDGVHLSPFGCEVLGKRTASLFVGRGYLYTERIYGERMINSSSSYDNLEGNIEVTQSNYSKKYSPIYLNGNAESILITPNNSLYYSFYLEEDKKYIMPVGFLRASAFTYSLDFGLIQPQYKLYSKTTDSYNETSIPINSNSIESGGDEYYFNSIDDISNHICIQGKGWHTIKITCTRGGDGFQCNGIRFFNQIDDWKDLALSSGITSFGKFNTQYRLENGTIKFRGSLVCPTPSVDTKLFDIPNELQEYMTPNLHVELPQTWSYVTLYYGHVPEYDKAIYWKGGTGNGANLVNLENLEIKLYYI